MAYFRFTTTINNLYKDMFNLIESTNIYEDISIDKSKYHVMYSKGETGNDDIYIVLGANMNKYPNSNSYYHKMFVTIASNYNISTGNFTNIVSRYASNSKDTNFASYYDGCGSVYYSTTPNTVINVNTPLEVLLVVTKDYITCMWWSKISSIVCNNGFFVGMIDRLNRLDKKAIVRMPFSYCTQSYNNMGGWSEHTVNGCTNYHGYVLALADYKYSTYHFEWLGFTAPTFLYSSPYSSSMSFGTHASGDNNYLYTMFDIAVPTSSINSTNNNYEKGIRGYLPGVKTFGHAGLGYKNGDIITDKNGTQYMYYRLLGSFENYIYRALGHLADQYLIELR